jgi:uncharacterized repeat protein (TIGR01451 family)
MCINRAAFISMVVGWAVGRAGAQPSFGLSVTSAPNPVRVAESLTYTISVTNLSVFQVTDVFITNHFSASALFVTSTNSIVSTVTTNAEDMTFRITSLPGGQIALFSLVVSPRLFGPLTNTVTVASYSLTTTNATNSVITQVTAGQSDLGVSLSGPAGPILANDWITYRLAVTNRGPEAAPGILVSNRLPADVGFISVTVSNQSVTFTNHSVLWNVGTLVSGDSESLTLRVQPTNAGNSALLATVSAPNVIDANLTNNLAIAVLNVLPLVTGSLVVSNGSSAMRFNPQTALMEQTVRLVNVGTTNVAAARIIVSGLTNGLFNAVGTNDGHPFVVHGADLSPNQGVDLLLNYLVPTRQSFVVADSQLRAFELATVDTSIPAGTPVGITRLVLLPSGDVLMEFPATSGRTYSVLYSDGLNFTNARAALPSVMPKADRVQWIDYGPPETSSRPAASSARFYRVIENQ